MVARKVISAFLAFLILLPATQGWGQSQQSLQDQAQFYLQKIGPGQAPAMPPTPLPSSQIPFRSELPRQAAPTAPSLAQILTTAPRQPEEVSAIERRAWSQKMFIRQFGYSFFSQPPASFLPIQEVPVGPDYVIGPGDRIKIFIWGSVQGEYNLTVGRNGQIDIPKVGVVHVSSLTYRQLREVLDREFSRQYNNFQMNVTLDNLRTIQIYLVGQARFPGSYAVSSLSTLVSALFAGGGPSKSGSLRDIQVRRGRKVLVHFDFYDFLLRGDKSKDIRLADGDVIFIPPVGPLVAIGSPKTVNEIEEEIRLLARAQLEEDSSRTYGRETGPLVGGKNEVLTWRQRENIGIVTGKPPQEIMEKEKPAIPPLLKSFSEPESKIKEEQFERHYGMTLEEAYSKLASSRMMKGTEVIKVPGIYEMKNETSLADLIRLAGGLGDTAYKGRVQVLRVKDRQEMVLFDEDLAKVATWRFRDFRLVSGDFVQIFPVPSQVEKKVAIAGAVKNPGEFGFQDNMRVMDLVKYAGGLLQQCDKKEAEITRVTITSQGPETNRIYIKLYRALAGNPRDNVLLKPNDYLLIKTLPDWNIFRTVTLAGEVKSPGTYNIEKGETLSSLLARAGGFTDKAYLLGAVLTRQSSQKIQKRQLDAAIDRMEAEALAVAGSKATGGAGEEEAKRAEVFATQQMRLLASLRKVQPIGRVIIHLDDPERLRGTPNDVPLEQGDTLLVPESHQTVNVVGAVFNPTAIVYTPYRTVGDYVTIAGGTTKIADAKEIYVIKVNGAAVSRQGFKWFGSSWDGTKYIYHPGGIGSLTLDPGDTIVVPEQLEKIEWLKQMKDIATIIGNIALTAGVVLVGLK